MAAKQTGGIHVPFHSELTPKLNDFSQRRKRPKTKIIHHALALLFELENPDQEKHKALTDAIDRKFSVPKNIPHRSFYGFLYMLGSKYPNESSKSFWSEIIYITGLEKSHKQIFEEITSDYEISLRSIHEKKRKVRPLKS